MAMAAPGVSEMVVFLAMFFGGGFGFSLGVPPDKEDPLLARVAPEECLFYTSWAGIAKPDPDSGNRTERLIAEPEVQQLIAILDEQIRHSQRAAAANQRDPKARVLIEAGPNLLKTLLTRPTALFVSSVRLGPDGPDLKGGLLVNLGEDVAEVKALLERLQSETLGDQVETVDIAGSTYSRFQPGPRAPRLTWGTRGEHLIVGIGEGGVEAILERAEAEPPRWLVALRERLPVERRSTVSYCDLEMLKNMLIPLGGPQARRVVDALGAGNISAFGAVTGLDQSGFVKRTWLGIDGEPQGVLQALFSQPLTPEDLKPIPHDTPLALAFRLDLGRLLDAVLVAVGQIDSNAGAQMSQGLQQVEGMLGFELQGDLFQALGNVWTVHAAPDNGGLLTGWMITVQVQDRQKLGEIQERLLNLAAAIRGNNPRRTEIRKLQVADETVHYLFVPGQGFPLSPAWCVTDKQLVIAMFPHTIKGFLSRGEDVKTLAEIPSVARLLNDGGGSFGVTYYDSRKLFRIVYPFIQFGLQMALSEATRGELAFDASILPSAGSIEKHLMPSASAVRRTPSGVEWISHQTVPGGSVGASTPVAVALLLPAVQQAREAARRTSSMNNLKQIGLAMHNFHDVYAAFPAAHSADKQGVPLMSWRVRILPFVDEAELYDRFHHDEPWDSEHNKTLISEMPAVYRSPNSTADPGKTVYLGIRGKKGVLIAPRKDDPGFTGTRIADIIDGTSNTIMVVEASDDKAVIWTKPDDFEPDDNNPINGLVGLRVSGFLALFCDGSVRFISEAIDQETLQLLFQKNDGKPIPAF